VSRKRRPRHTPRGSRAPRVPHAPHRRAAPPAARSLPWLVRPRSSKFRTFWWTVEIALWTSAVVCIVIRPGDFCLALLLAALAVGLVLASTDKSRRY
jgi:hypothetical protein